MKLCSLGFAETQRELQRGDYRGRRMGRDGSAQRVRYPKEQAAVRWTQALMRRQHVLSPKNTVGNLKSVSGDQEPQI